MRESSKTGEKLGKKLEEKKPGAPIAFGMP